MSDTSENRAPAAKPGQKSSRGKKWIVLLGVLFLLLAGSFYAATKFFPKWNEQRLVQRAHHSLEIKDYHAASITIRRILQLNPKSFDAALMMADIADAMNARNSLYWYHRLAEMRPDEPKYQLELAERALRFGNLATAGQVIENANEKVRATARYHELAGRLAVATKRPADAEAELSKAVEMEPDNKNFVFEWAVQGVQSSETAKHDRARQSLEESRKDPQYFSQASRALIDDALRKYDWERAFSLGGGLWTTKTTSLDDKLVHLRLLHEFKRPEFPGFLEFLEDKLISSPEDTATLLTWMGSNGCALLAVEWSKRLPSSLATTMPVPMAIAKAYVSLGDWTGLKAIVVEPPSENDADKPNAQDASGPNKQWEAYDFMRLALASRALREQGDLNNSRIQWNAALKSIGKRPEALAVLARAAVDWGWENESTELLWAVANTSTESRWALDILYYRYSTTGATRNMLQVLYRMRQLDPTDIWVLNNLASLSLLSESTAQQGVAYAEDLYQRDRQNPAYISTYAFALHLQGRTAEGVKLIESLGEETLLKPEYALYYGTLLAEIGEREKARRYLEIGGKAKLLPEEKALMNRALAKVDR